MDSTYRDDDVGRIALRCEHAQPADGVLIADNLIERLRPVFLDPRQIFALWIGRECVRGGRCAAGRGGDGVDFHSSFWSAESIKLECANLIRARILI